MLAGVRISLWFWCVVGNFGAMNGKEEEMTGFDGTVAGISIDGTSVDSFFTHNFSISILLTLSTLLTLLILSLLLLPRFSLKF